MRKLDLILVDQHKVSSRSRAQRLISEGKVKVRQFGDWKTPVKAGQKYPDGIEIDICQDETDQFASRGGIKLAGALEVSGISLMGAIVIDVGQSTGGFTDCALRAGASKVVGVDVGHSQLKESLRNDPGVVCLEGGAMPDRYLKACLISQSFARAMILLLLMCRSSLKPKCCRH